MLNLRIYLKIYFYQKYYQFISSSSVGFSIFFLFLCEIFSCDDMVFLHHFLQIMCKVVTMLSKDTVEHLLLPRFCDLCSDARLFQVRKVTSFIPCLCLTKRHYVTVIHRLYPVVSAGVATA